MSSLMVKEYVLQIIKDHIFNQITDIQNVDIEELCLCANQHQIAPIIYYQTKNPQLSSAYYSAVSVNTNRQKITKELLNVLSNEGIKAFPVKGPVVSSFYPVPILRTMGDTDIVVDDLDAAHAVMLRQGFSCISANEGREWQYQKNGLEYELHDRLLFDEACNEKSITAFINDYQSFVSDDGLNLSFHFIYELVHLRKHFMNSGVGIRQFLDIAMMEKNCHELDWTWIEKKLEEIELLHFAKTVFAFIEHWWGVKSPISCNVLSNGFFQSGTEYIFKNGVFGRNNPENDNYLIANEIRKSGIFARLKRIVTHFFPSYKVMCKAEKYSFIIKRPLLLPVAWIYRWFTIVFEGRVNSGAKNLSRAFVSGDYVDEREKMFKQWGLTG